MTKKFLIDAEVEVLQTYRVLNFPVEAESPDEAKAVAVEELCDGAGTLRFYGSIKSTEYLRKDFKVLPRDASYRVVTVLGDEVVSEVYHNITRDKLTRILDTQPGVLKSVEQLEEDQ